jgi:hypothetical protein
VVTEINTRGDEGGWVKLAGNGVHVAQIVEDIDEVHTGGVEVFLKSGKFWRKVAGLLIVKAVSTGGKTYHLANKTHSLIHFTHSLIHSFTHSFILVSTVLSSLVLSPLTYVHS